jgi:DNA modification methylase
MNKLILGDNLEIMQKMESESIDLIYLDPPFFSNRNYEVIWGDSGEIRSFEDRWAGGVEHYIAWLKERVVEMHRLLKSTGSIFLHCDWHANSHIRVYILDKIFGEKNFRNEIIWCYTRPSASKKQLPRVHDTIFWYAKTEKVVPNFDNIRVPYSEESLARSNRGIGVKSVMGTKSGEDRLNELGKLPESYWQIPIIQGNGKERIGYPTQKPEKLLERIIKMGSNENDIIFDPFVGGGTTIAVSEKLKRKWIGIDQSVQAIKVTEFRLSRDKDLFSSPFVVQLHKYDYDTLRYKDAFEFETWIVGQFGGISNAKQRGDLGLDGRTRDNQPIQVKRSENIGRNVVDNFASAVKRFDKTLYEKNIAEGTVAGYIIAFSFGKGAVQEVARLKNEENVIIQLVTVESIVPIAKKPNLTVEIRDCGANGKHLREIEFIAKGESTEGKTIEFYAWDFNYNDVTFSAEILRDTVGKQKKNI